MEPRALLDALTVAERLKDTTRHCYTSQGRHESVAEHSWMMTLMVFFMQDEFPEADMDKVMRMCVLHDLYREMEARQTLEAKIYKAIDGLEALIQHNFSDLSTWSENEFALNLTYAQDRVTFSKYLTQLREEIRQDTVKKIQSSTHST